MNTQTEKGTETATQGGQRQTGERATDRHKEIRDAVTHFPNLLFTVILAFVKQWQHVGLSVSWVFMERKSFAWGEGEPFSLSLTPQFTLSAKRIQTC